MPLRLETEWVVVVVLKGANSTAAHPRGKLTSMYLSK